MPEERWKTLAVVPLAIPGTVGAGTITTVVVQATTYPGIRDLGIVTAAAAFTALVMWLTCCVPPSPCRRLGPTGLNVDARHGILVSATAFGLPRPRHGGTSARLAR